MDFLLSQDQGGDTDKCTYGHVNSIHVWKSWPLIKPATWWMKQVKFNKTFEFLSHYKLTVTLRLQSISYPDHPKWHFQKTIHQRHILRSTKACRERKKPSTKVTSMIHLARPTVSPVATFVFGCIVLLDLKSGDGSGRTEDNMWVGRVDQKTIGKSDISP